MDAVERGQFARRCRSWFGVCGLLTFPLLRGNFDRFVFHSGKRRRVIFLLLWGRCLTQVSRGLDAALAEELRRTLRDRQQSDDTLRGADDTLFPVVEVNAERLGESADHIERQREPLRLLAVLAPGLIFFVFVLVRFVFDVEFELFVRGSFGGGGLKRPEEQRGEAGVFFQSGCSAGLLQYFL